MSDIEDDAVVAALLRERDGYAARGLTGRVAEVDASLSARGYAVAARKRSEVRPATPKGRRVRGPEVAE